MPVDPTARRAADAAVRRRPPSQAGAAGAASTGLIQMPVAPTAQQAAGAAGPAVWK
jgi:hypothetical protein